MRSHRSTSRMGDIVGRTLRKKARSIWRRKVDRSPAPRPRRPFFPPLRHGYDVVHRGTAAGCSGWIVNGPPAQQGGQSCRPEAAPTPTQMVNCVIRGSKRPIRVSRVLSSRRSAAWKERSACACSICARPFGERGPNKYRHMLPNTAAEKLGHIEMLATTVRLTSKARRFRAGGGVSKHGRRFVINGMDFQHLLSTRLAALPAANDVPFDCSHVYDGGNLEAGMYANVTARPPAAFLRSASTI